MMMRIAITLLALLFSVEIAHAVTASAKPFALVSGNVIRLGDIFSDVGDKADIPVGQAPPLGRSITLDAVALSEIARTHRLDWRAFSRYDKVVVERASHTIEADQIAASLRDALGRAGIGQNHDVQLDTRNMRLIIAAGTTPTIEIRDLRFDERSERFTAVATIAGDSSAPTLSISGQAVRVVEAPALIRRVNRGEVIQAHDIKINRMRAATFPPDALTRTGAIIGKAARRGLSPGEALRATDLQAPVIVERGSLVTMIVQTPYMTLSTQGRALDEGAMGDTIRVMNARSKKVVEAQVTKPDTVIIQAAILNLE